MGAKVLHFLQSSIPRALRASETGACIAARKVATFGAPKALDASAAARFAAAIAGRRPVDAGLTGSRCWLLLRRALRLGLLNLRMLERASDKLRFLRGLLITPTEAEWRRLQLPPPLYFLYYPYRLARLTQSLVAQAKWQPS